MQQCGALHCDFCPVCAHIAPSRTVHIEAINPHKWITKTAFSLKHQMDVGKRDQKQQNIACWIFEWLKIKCIWPSTYLIIIIVAAEGSQGTMNWRTSTHLNSWTRCGADDRDLKGRGWEEGTVGDKATDPVEHQDSNQFRGVSDSWMVWKIVSGRMRMRMLVEKNAGYVSLHSSLAT